MNGVQAAPKSLVVGIDFGTHGTGFGFVRTRAAGTAAAGAALPVVVHDAYLEDGDLRSVKTRSVVLYRRRRMVACGNEAIKQMAELSPAEQAEHMLVENFKLGLECPNTVRVPEGMTVEQVIIDYLTWFQRYAKGALQAALGSAAVQEGSIKWCLTVPAMWGEGSKQAMRRIARRAGLIRIEEDVEGLSIILEPEAAALYALDNQAPPLVDGEHVLVLDAGGGTVDATLHRAVARGGGGRVVLAEAVSGAGGFCGSTFVDAAFLAHYRNTVGEQAFDAWVRQYPTERLQVMNKFEAIKRDFGKNASSGNVLFRPGGSTSSAVSDDAVIGAKVFIPPRLHGLMTEEDRLTLTTEQGMDTDVVLDDETLKSLFRGPVDDIIKLSKAQVQALQQATGERCDKVLLAGGFAASPFLQARVKQELAEAGLVGEVVICGRRPEAAVVSGSVVYGHDPDLIRARCARMAYGVRACAPWSEGAPASGRFWHEEEAQYYTDAVFCCFVERNQLVERDEEVLHYFVPIYTHQTEARIPLYASLRNDIRYLDLPDFEWEEEDRANNAVGGGGGGVTAGPAGGCPRDGVHRVGELIVPLPSGGDATQRVVCVKMLFGRTEIAATAWDEETQEVMQVQVKFACSS